MTEKEKKAEKKPKEIDPELKDFIDRVIVPALVRGWLADEQVQRSLASPSNAQPSESSDEPSQPAGKLRHKREVGKA